MSWGTWGKNLQTSSKTDLIKFCLDNGLSTFDHADIYGDYSTEKEFGTALKRSEINRETVQLISKCGIQYLGRARKNTVKHYNYSKDYIIWSAEQSLKNLQSEYLDTFLLHRPSPLMHPDEISEAIFNLKKDGKILDFGVSNFTPSQTDLINSKSAVSINQIEFSLTAPMAMHNGSLDHMLLNGITPMAWSPLGSIFKSNTAEARRVLSVLEDLSHKYSCSPDTLLYTWILKHPAKIYPVIGTTEKERMKNALSALKLDLELEDWFKLLVASQGHKVP